MLSSMAKENNWIVVTGASSGIGEATVKKLLENGYRVIATSRNRKRLLELFCHSNKCMIIDWDLSDLESINEYAKKVHEEVGPINGLVHCAGKGIGNTVQMIKTKMIYDIFEVNTFAPLLLVSAFSKNKMANSGSSFILISSIAVPCGAHGQSVYSATKGALEGFIKGSAFELSKKKIRLNGIAPGIIKANLAKSHYEMLGEESNKNPETRSPLGIGEPEDVAVMIEFLLSEKSSWITGQVFIVDGGFSVRKIEL